MYFIKGYGLGNDFIIIFDNVDNVNLKLLADRKFGIGADQIIQSLPYKDGYKVRFWNQDGSEASLCGNGIRCLAKHYKKASKFYTQSGMIRAVPIGDQIAFCLPVIPKVKKFDYRLDAYDVNIGNEHIIIFGNGEPEWNIITNDLKDHLSVRNIMWIWKTENWNIRSWERGVGETLACGSGAIASACAIWENAGDSLLTFQTKAGKLCVLKKKKIWQIGPANVIAEGNLDLKNFI